MAHWLVSPMPTRSSTGRPCLLLPLVLWGGQEEEYSRAKMGLEIETITPGDGGNNWTFLTL